MIADLAAALEASDLALALRRSRWIYPLVNSAHVLGVALLVGAVVPMDLRLMGVRRASLPAADALRLLQPVAAAGAVLAIATGLLMAIVQAGDYLGQPLFWFKMGLVAIGLAHALAWGGRLGAADGRRQKIAGLLSLAVWLPALVCGRLLGYL